MFLFYWFRTVRLVCLLKILLKAVTWNGVFKQVIEQIMLTVIFTHAIIEFKFNTFASQSKLDDFIQLLFIFTPNNRFYWFFSVLQIFYRIPGTVQPLSSLICVSMTDSDQQVMQIDKFMIGAVN